MKMTPGLILESVGEDTTAIQRVYGQGVRVSTILGLVPRRLESRR